MSVLLGERVKIGVSRETSWIKENVSRETGPSEAKMPFPRFYVRG